MGMKKLLDKLGSLLDPAVEKRKKYRKQLKSVLKELKSREKALQQKLEKTDDEHKRDRLQKEMDIIHKQRMKGVSAMRSGEEVSSDDKQKSE